MITISSPNDDKNIDNIPDNTRLTDSPYNSSSIALEENINNTDKTTTNTSEYSDNNNEYFPSSRMRIKRYDETPEYDSQLPWILRKNPKNGGFKYIVLLGSFCGMILFGLALCMSLFTQPWIDYFHISNTMGTIPMTIAFFLFCVVSVFTNQVATDNGIHKVFMIMMACEFLSMFLPSLVNNFYCIIVIFGVFNAIGSSGAGLLSINILEDWYLNINRLGFATGTAFAGVGVGGVLFPWVMNYFLSYGWHLAIRYTSFVVLFFIIIAVICMQPRCFSTKYAYSIMIENGQIFFPSFSDEEILQKYKDQLAIHSSIIEWGLFKQWRYVLVLLAAIFGNLFFYAPYYALVLDAMNKGFSQDQAAFFLAIIGFLNIIWRPLWGFIADYSGGIFVFMMANLLQFICSIWWQWCDTYTEFCLLSIVIGMSGAGYDAGIPTAAEQSLPQSKLQAGIGMLFFLGFIFGGFSGPILESDYESHHNLRISLTVFSVLSGIAALLLLILMGLLYKFPKSNDTFKILVVTEEEYIKQVKYEFASLILTGAFPVDFPDLYSVDEVITKAIQFNSNKHIKPDQQSPEEDEYDFITEVELQQMATSEFIV